MLIYFVQIPRALLEAGAEINTETTLSIAAGYGDLEIVKIMLERGSNVNQPNREALKRAREEWEKEIELEVDAKMADDVDHPNPQRRRKGFYEEICKAKWGNTTIDNIMYLSRIHSTIMNPTNLKIISDLKPPIIAASRNGHDKIVALLLANGAEVDIIHKNGRETIVATAVAAKAGHVEVLRTLLDHGALVDGPPEVLDYWTGKDIRRINFH